MPEDIKWFIKWFISVDKALTICVGKSILKAHNMDLWFFQGQKWWHKTFLRNFSPVKPFSHCSLADLADLQADCLYFWRFSAFSTRVLSTAHVSTEELTHPTESHCVAMDGLILVESPLIPPSLSRARITGVSYLQVKTATHGRWYWLGL